MDPAPPPVAYLAGSGGIFRDCGVHDFDIIRWVTGREVVEVYATGSNQGADFFAAAGDVDTSAAVLTLDDGALALVSNTRYNPRGYDVRLEVHGSKDSIAVGLEKKLPLRSVEPLATFPTVCPTGCSWTGSWPPTRPSWRCSPSSWPGTGAARAARWRTAWRPT
jgi:myo-inositol 2-dehydrogenase/D-chiro-inositol 1-dehydrogenase